MIEGAVTVSCIEIRGRHYESVERTVIEETPLAIYVNGRELATLMCTPIAVDDLVMGFLIGEGIIATSEDVALLRVCLDEGLANVRLVRPEVVMPERRILTSGCSGGVTFDHLSGQHPPLSSALRIPPPRIAELMDLMQRSGPLHGRTWGLHTSALSDGEVLLAVAQDVGRHNTVDKVWGECLRRSIVTEGRILLSTGRISSEMLNKAAKMGVPVVASRTSPTSLSLPLAEAWGITLIGYVRGGRMDVYTHPRRVEACGDGISGASSAMIITACETDFGWVGVAAGDTGLVGLTLPQSTEAEALRRLQERHGSGQPDDGRLAALKMRLQAYFRGEEVGFEEWALDPGEGTPFQRRVWQITRSIGRGETRTYGEVARAAGSAGGARAVGQAMARNPWPIVVPCHRVVGSGGELTGFGGGVDLKRQLLRMEKPRI